MRRQSKQCGSSSQFITNAPLKSKMASAGLRVSELNLKCRAHYSGMTLTHVVSFFLKINRKEQTPTQKDSLKEIRLEIIWVKFNLISEKGRKKVVRVETIRALT